jgi:hypothetical protein
MGAVALSGFAITALWLAVPLVVKPAPAGVDPAAHAAELREAGAFLGYLAWIIVGALSAGLRVLRVAREESVVDRGIAALTVAGGVTLGIAGLLTWNPLFVMFGVVGILNGRQDLRAPDRRTRIWRHGRAMGGAAVAALTAFLVFGSRRFVHVPDAVALLPWALPSLVGTPLMLWLVRPYRPA